MFIWVTEYRLCVHFLLINAEMPTIVGILTFMSGKISCSAELSMNFFYNLEASVLSEQR